jgi:VanZ family protein
MHSGTSGRLLTRLLAVLGISLSTAALAGLNLFARKVAHFVVYAVLSGLFFRAFRASDRDPRAWRSRWMWLSLTVCFATASGDELRQALTLLRSGEVHDVLLDMFGAASMQWVIWRRTWLRDLSG